MKSYLAHYLVRGLSFLPLSTLQNLGRCAARLSPPSSRFQKRLRENIQHSQIAESYQAEQALVKQSIAHIGMGAAELAIAWQRSSEYIANLVQDCEGWEYVEQALKKQHGLLFLTPHLGNYDIAGRYLSQRLPFPVTAMYKPPRLSWLEPLMVEGRCRDNGRVAPANLQGVRQVIKALRQGEATILLPDQVPSRGEGCWAHFFGRPAYTMTLASRLALIPQVTTLLFYGKRLPHAQGFNIVIQPLSSTFSGEKYTDAQLLNTEMEHLIRKIPEQYLWSYNRYKCPAGVTPYNSPIQDN